MYLVAINLQIRILEITSLSNLRELGKQVVFT